MGLTLFQNFKDIETETIKITNNLESKNVKINNDNNYLEVLNNQGKKVFWIDEDGANIKQLETITELNDIVGFPSIRDGLLIGKDNQLEFTKDLEITNLKVDSGLINSIESKKITADVANTITINSNSVLCKVANADKLISNEAKITNLNTDELTAKSIKVDDLKCGNLDCDNFKPTDIETDNLLSKHINTEELNAGSLQAKEAGIANLETQNILTQRMDIIETANIKVLNNEDAIINELKVSNAHIDNLKYNKMIKNIKSYGSVEEPLVLNVVDTKYLDVNNETGSLKIFNKIVDKTPQNKIELTNLPEGDYIVNTICHNQFINIRYNLCKVDGKTYLFARFNENPNNLIVEIILERV